MKILSTLLISNNTILSSRGDSLQQQIPVLNCAETTECLESIIAYYQPQFWVASGELYGAEALARWNHQERGILGPLYLLPRLNSIKLHEALWVKMLDHAMRMLEQLQGSKLCIGVNVSADVASSANWAENVARYFALTRLSTEYLNIEITEEACDFSDSGLTDAVSQLRLCGFDCAIDDFGIGYSSLQRLMLTPFSALKIDQSFVHHARSSMIGHKILANTITMAHDLGLTVIAEGIETEDDFERIRKLGADIAQGYYFSKPIPETEFIAYTKMCNLSFVQKSNVQRTRACHVSFDQ